MDINKLAATNQSLPLTTGKKIERTEAEDQLPADQVQIGWHGKPICYMYMGDLKVVKESDAEALKEQRQVTLANLVEEGLITSDAAGKAMEVQVMSLPGFSGKPTCYMPF